MSFNMSVEDAMTYRQLLEPITMKMTGTPDAGPEIVTTSIAVSLRRIADALEKQNKLIDVLTQVHKVKR